MQGENKNKCRDRHTVESRRPEPAEAKLAPLMYAAAAAIVVFLVTSLLLLLLAAVAAMRER